MMESLLSSEHPNRESLFASPRLALKEAGKALLTVKTSLTDPYPDDPRWTPWSRWIEHPRVLAKLDAGLIALKEAEADAARDKEMLALAAADTSYADLRQEIEFKRTAVTAALDVLEERAACHCHLYVEFPRIQEIKGPNPPRACPRCKAIDAIRAEFAGWCE